MNSKLLIVFRKELRETLREKRTLATLVLMTLIYPFIIGLTLNQIISKNTTTEREGIDIAVIGGARAPTLMAQLGQKNISVKDQAPMSDEAIAELLRAKQAVAVLRLSEDFADNYQAMRPARVEVWYDSAAEGGAQRREVEEVLEAYGNNIASARLLAHGVSPAALTPIQVQRYDTGTNASRSAALIGGMIGVLFFPAFMLTMSSAIDSTAGERERRSFEVLMAQPAHAWELIGGKWLAASVLGVLGVTASLVLGHVIFKWLRLEEIAVPLSLLAGALYVALAMNARTFKEAQTLLSIVLIVPLIPGMVVSFLDLKTAQWMYLVPMLSHQTLAKEAAKGGDVGTLPWALTFLCSLVPALAVIAFAAWRMKSEKYVLSV